MSARRVTRHKTHRHAEGFSLVELAVVLAIVALLIGGMMMTLSAQIEQRNVAETRRSLEEARDLVLGFAIVNGRLPCPASTTSNGDESPLGGGACTDPYSGYLPAKAIGIQPVDSFGYALDSWGNRIRYAVSANASVSGSPDNNFTTSGSMTDNGITVTPSDLLICAAWASNVDTSTSSPSCGSAASLTTSSPPNVAAVIWSQGKNYATASYGGVSGQAGDDEKMNNKIRLPTANNNHGVFVSHTPAPQDASGGEFDDYVVWIPVGLLYGRLIAAGVLP